MECQNEHQIEVPPTETKFLNGFPMISSSVSAKEPQPTSDINRAENLEIHTEKESSEHSDIPILLQVFKDVYDQRIISIENNDNFDSNRKNEEKLAILRQYLQQLQEQNDTFVTTLLELETEAQQRVKQMEKRLKSSAKTTMEAVINVHECEKEMRRIVEERLYIESHYNDMQQHISNLKVENGFLRDQNCNLNHDVQALLHIIHHARSTGHWEMNCVTFCEVTPEQVFGPVQSISNLYTESPQSDFQEENEKKIVSNSDNSSQEAIDSNTSSPRFHHAGSRLRDKNLSSPFQSDDCHNELLEKDKNIAFLESQLSELRHQLTMKDAECECHLWKLEMLTQQNRNRVQIYPADLPSSGASLPKCISLPDIGNIYSFTNAIRKSHSYGVFGNTQTFCVKVPRMSANCVRTRYDDVSEFQKCRTLNKKSDSPSCIRRGQSEPHLFMYGDNIYVYRPCEPIKKVSNFALHDDYEMSLPPCQSIDLKFPTEDSSTKMCDWAIMGKSGSYSAPHSSYYKDDESSSSCTCSDPEIENINTEIFSQFERAVSICVQTEHTMTYSIGLQAAIKRDDESSCMCSCSDPGVNRFDTKMFTSLLGKELSSAVQKSKSAMNSSGFQTDINIEKSQDGMEDNGSFQMDMHQMINIMQTLKENLVKAEDKAEAKDILLTQLQSHLTSAVKEVELKDTALNNLEKKLDLSRNESASIKKQVYDLNSKIQQLLKDLDDMQMLNDNLQLKADAKEEKIKEVLLEQKVLQEQKRALLTQLDTQGDELEKSTKELKTNKHKADSCSLQMEQQSQIIRNLQEALVQSKRAFDATHLKAPSSHAVSSSHFENGSKSSSKSSIVDI